MAIRIIGRCAFSKFWR